MNQRLLNQLIVPALVLLGIVIGVSGNRLWVSVNETSNVAYSVGLNPIDTPPEAPLQIGAAGQLIQSYAAKFVCREPLQPGQFWYGAAAPLIKEETDVLIHNPNAFAVELYKKAVLSPVENFLTTTQGVAPGKWKKVRLAPDYSFRIDCDDIAKLLTDNASATFIGTYGIGVKVEGFVVIGMGPQAVSGAVRYGPLDVVAEYARGSEVMKKDIHYQPWWTWWWWPLPWRLGYAYQRILTIDPATNIDCRGMLYGALTQDAQAIADTQQRNLTLAALDAGRLTDPTSIATRLVSPTQTALVALIGRCDKITMTAMSVDYVLMSNKGPTDQDPRGGGTTVVAYPWIPGRWYDLALVTPQNLDVDMHDYMLKWQTQRWVSTGASPATVQAAMAYYFPYWCGWHYWWWWTNSGDCIDIGVGEGESLDVEQIVPTRVFMPVWPPQ